MMASEKTKPRGPIAAMYSSPGPCYQLPSLVGSIMHDPRSSHQKNPAWQFGTRHAKLFDDASPGPVHYPDVQYTRHGKNGMPHYSLYSRPQDLKSFKTPGPGAHSPEAAGPSASPRAPSYSFGSRSKYRSIDKNPAPNTYSLPTLTGRTVEGNKRQAPMPSVRGRSNVGSFSEDLQKTPGPGAYAQADPNVYKGRAPLYTLRPRVVMPGDSTLKPGPGAHSPERVVITKHQAPQFSFGNKHSEYLTPLIVDVEE